ncbi:Short-chain dehydrogenase [Penicillium rolfsii]|nr:Short-chain dehydrogenase [Penicillium rolfsii]
MAFDRKFNDQSGALEVAQAFADEIRGKCVLVTGAGLKGIGGATAKAFASQKPACLIVSGRSQSKLEDMVSALKESHPDVHVKSLVMDLSSQASVRAAAKEVLAYPENIDILVNNAGMALSDKRLSEDGIELQLATNHLGPFLFTNLIMEKLMAAAKVNPPGSTRIVNLTSLGYLFSPIRFSDFNFEKLEVPEDEQPDRQSITQFGLPLGEPPFGSWEAYGQSKTAAILFATYLTSRLKSHGILSYAVHPGLVQTELSRDLPGSADDLEDLRGAIQSKTLDQGAATSLVAALDPSITAASGPFLMDCQPAEAREYAKDQAKAEKLWDLSERLVGQKFNL